MVPWFGLRMVAAAKLGLSSRAGESLAFDDDIAPCLRGAADGHELGELFRLPLRRKLRARWQATTCAVGCAAEEDGSWS